MKRLGPIVAMLFGSALLLALSGVAARADKRVALVVGNSAYQNVGRLPNPSSDADAVAQMFKKAGYEVSLLKDVGSLDFKRGIRKFEDTASSADIAVVFYAGHGIEIGGTNYMIPVDAKLATDRDARDEAIELERIIESVEPAKKLRLVILDACRDNPFFASMKRRQAMRATPSSGLGPAPDLGSEILIAYAAKQGSTAEDGKGEHSPFTTAILNNLTEPGLDIRLAFGRVRDEVIRITNNRQEPYVYGSLGGTNVALVPLPEKSRAVDQDKVRFDYELVMKVFEKVGSKKPLEVFLDQYPTGLYSELVRAQLHQFEANEKIQLASVPPQAPRGPTMTLPNEKAKLATVPQQVPPAPAQPSQDTQAWDDVKDTSDPELLRKFMQRYKDSPKYLEAQHRLEILLRNAREREEAARAEAAEAKRLKAEAEAAARRQKAEAEAAAKRQKAEAELANAWAAVQYTDDQNRLRDFIRRYPDSQHAAEAKQRLEAIVREAREREEQARILAAETRRQQAEAEMARAFDNVRVTTDQAMVRDFIRRYPDSPYVADAKKRLEELVRVAQEREEQARLGAVEAKRQKTEAEAASAWNSIKNTTDPAELQRFIKRFPETSLALNEATQRLGALDREARERVARTQAEAAVARSAWDRIKGTADVAEVENFIKLYPGTPTALTDAKQLLEVLDRRAKEREAKVRMEADAAQAWNRIKGTRDPAELRGFIKRFPNSPLALSDAAQHLAALERDAKDRAEKAQAEAAEARAAWNTVKNTSDPAELRDFMKRYPDSPLAIRDAKLAIEQLERQAKEREAKARTEAEVTAAWDSTKDSRDPADFRSFIKRYPNSAFTAEAKQRLAAIEPKPEVRTKPEIAAKPDIRTKPEVEKRHEIASPPPPKAKEKVATRPREERVEPRRQQRERPVERAERPAPRQQPSVRYEAVARPSGGGHSGTMSGVGF